MTDIEQKAVALVNEVQAERGKFRYFNINRRDNAIREALCRAVEQREATKQEFSDFRQEVSDELIQQGFINASTGIGRFIIPKPDPLVEALNESGVILAGPVAKRLRAALEARGLEIREKNDDQ